ncbi:MAG: long-chain fatty acid--CoA ligase [Alphaproteobacteria bacterium]|nr:long-chain fatty acid--CoA ligase [Alphaproteobacteria bacterium]
MSAQPWIKSYPPGLKWDVAIEAKPLYAVLDDAVANYPDNWCLDFMGKRLTYREVGNLVARAAAGFQRLGVGKGVKVGLFLPNCPQYVVSYYGILKAGGTVVNYSPLYAERELIHQIEDSHTDIMVTLNLKALLPKMEQMLVQSRLKKLIIGTMSEVLPFPKNLLFPLVKRGDIQTYAPDDRHLSFKWLTENDGNFATPAIDPRKDVALLQYTGGTTGVPKGAMLTHYNLYCNTQQSTMWFTNVDLGRERVLGVLPFFHVFAMTGVMNMGLNIGAEIVMHPRFELEAVLKDINTKKPTLMPGVPTMFVAINNHPRLKEFDLRSLKGCITGGAPMPLEVRDSFEKTSGATLIEGYGLTESSPTASCNPLVGVRKAGSIGIPMPGTSIEIVDRDDPMKPMPIGQPGQICIRGPQVMAGYWQKPEATAATVIDGKLLTGDVGYMDEDGYTFIIDRMKDMILVGGFNVFPRNVEEAIYQHPAVEECTVIGIPDDYLGQVPKAFLKLKAGNNISTESLMEFLKDRLGKHELPRFIEVRDALPKTMIGKLSKKELVEEEKKKHEDRKKAKA